MVLIVLLTSMTAWYLVRVKSHFTKVLYYLFAFAMIVPFQMVMFTLVKVSNMFKLDNLIGIVFIYVGFGAGLSVFMFTGFIKSIPVSLEEAAMIDGCSIMKIYFNVVLPVIRPTVMTVAILNAMWIWNDYLLPYLVIGSEYKKMCIRDRVSGFGYILPEDFEQEAFTQIYIMVHESGDVISYTDAYDNLIRQIQQRVEGLSLIHI